MGSLVVLQRGGAGVVVSVIVLGLLRVGLASGLNRRAGRVTTKPPR